MLCALLGVPLFLTGMGYTFVTFEFEHVDNNYANKSMPIGGPSSGSGPDDPQYFDCHERTSGLYPAYLATALCVVLTPLYATLDPQSNQTYARSKTPYCDTVLLTSVRSIWMPKMSCWLLCVAVGLWATTCPAPTVVQALLSAGGAVGGLTVGRRCEDDWYGLPQDVANDRAAFAFSINFVGALVAVGATLCVQFLSGFDYG